MTDASQQSDQLRSRHPAPQWQNIMGVGHPQRSVMAVLFFLIMRSIMKSPQTTRVYNRSDFWFSCNIRRLLPEEVNRMVFFPMTLTFNVIMGKSTLVDQTKFSRCSSLEARSL